VEEAAVCTLELLPEIRPSCPRTVSTAVQRCLLSVPGLIAAGQDCADQISKGTTLHLCPNSCYHFASALVTNGCVAGNSSLLAVASPETYAVVTELASGIVELDKHCSCLPWEMPPATEELAACATGLAGLGDSITVEDGLAAIPSTLRTEVTTSCEFLAAPSPSCTLNDGFENLRQCLSLARTIVASGVACQEELTAPGSLLEKLLDYSADDVCPEACVEFVVATSVFAVDELEGSGCNVTLEEAGVVIGDTGTELLESLAAVNAAMMTKLEESTCGDCAAAAVKLLREDIPTCLIDANCFPVPYLLERLSQGETPCPGWAGKVVRKRVAQYTDKYENLVQCMETTKALASAANDCLLSLADFEELLNTTSASTWLTCPAGCVAAMEEYISAECDLDLAQTLIQPADPGDPNAPGQPLKAAMAQIVHALPCSSACFDITIVAVVAELEECQYTGNWAQCTSSIPLLLANSPCPLPAEVQQCAAFLADVSGQGAGCAALFS